MSRILSSQIHLFLGVMFGLGIVITVLFAGLLALLTQQAKTGQRYETAVQQRILVEDITNLAVATAVERDLVARADLMHELEGVLDRYRMDQRLAQDGFDPDFVAPTQLSELAMVATDSARSDAVIAGTSALISHVTKDILPPLRQGIQADGDRLRNLRQLIFWATALMMVLVGLAVTVMIKYLFRPVARAAELTSRKLAKAQGALDLLEYTDALTGLPSLRGLDRFLETCPSPTAEGGAKAALMIKLEPVARNQRVLRDSFTQEVARELAQRLHMLRAETDFVAHCGQGRFFVLCNYGAPVDDQPRILDRIEQLLFEPVMVHGSRVAVDLMAGYRPVLPGEAVTDIHAEADIALGIALSTGAENRVRYTDTIRSKLAASSELGAELTHALNNNELVAHFQPQVSMRTGEVTGFEALVRWYHPGRGLLAPGLFLPLIEEMGLDDAMGEIMLNQGLQALKDWEAQGIMVQQLGLNFSQSQLRAPMLVETLRWELDRFDIQPGRVSVEVLENIYVENDEDRIASNIRALSNLGLNIDLDDFGTGTASITGLRRFRANRIKIDRSYISDLDKNLENQKLVSTMINMAQSMGIEALAEGVETEAEMVFLRSLGCQTVQGYAIAKPMPFNETITWLAEYNENLAAKRRAGRAVAV